MEIKDIYYTDRFFLQFRLLSKEIQRKAAKAEMFFRKNPFHPSLRLHKLKGRTEGAWSISVDLKNRIIFKPLEGGVVLFISIGSHAIYDTN